MQIAVLGPLTVHDDAGDPVAVSGVRLRSLLARLAIDAGRPVGSSALVDAVWGDTPPADETNALQTLVSRLRRLLGPSTLVATPGGYLLGVRAEDVDVHRFTELANRGAAEVRARNHGGADATLTAALDLWRGPPLSDSSDAAGPDNALAVHAARLTDLRVAALVDRTDARLALGDPRTVSDAEALAAEHPLHERLTGLVMRALAADGRQAEALQAYERLRTRLAEELGIDPSAELQQLHLSLLRGEVGAHVPARGTEPAARIHRTNLKAQLTSFVGRDAEVQRIAEALQQHRLVTLVGPGGAGKTRLSGEAAARLVDDTADGVWFVELAPVTSGDDVAQAVLDSIGLHDITALERRGVVNPLSARDAATRLVDGLAERAAVLVVDNCEHVIEATAGLADHLLARCAQLRILATSREPLGILGEALLPVPPLGQPAIGATAVQALQFPAVRLFADRAAAVRPDFLVDDSTVADVIEIVRRLDGLPLAIELAAARLRALALPDIAARLGDRFRLLTGGSRTALPRHRTLRAVVEWSWDLLDGRERLLAEQLAVFPAGVTVASAAQVSGGDPDDVADVLASLVDKSLLQPVGDGRRLRMLETIREYGAERLVERGELGLLRRRHAEHFAAVMAQADPYLRRSDQLPWFELLRDEMDNIVSALRHLCELQETDAAARLGISLGFHGLMLGDWENIGTWLHEVVALPGGDPDAMVLAQTLEAMGRSAFGATAENAGDDTDELAALAFRLGELPDATSPWLPIVRPIAAFLAELPDLAEKYFAAAHDHQDDWTRAAVRMWHANYAENQGDIDSVRADLATSMEIFGRLGERWGLANCLRGLAQLQTLDGELDAAAGSYREAMRLSGELHSREDEGYLYGRLTDLALRGGDIDSARTYVALARDAALQSGSPMESLFAVSMLAALEEAAGGAEAANELREEVLQRLATLPPNHPAMGHVRAIMLSSAARASLADGDLTQAFGTAGEALAAAIGTNDLPVIAIVGVAVAELLAARGDHVTGARVLGAAARLRGADDATAIDVRRVTSALRTALGDAAFSAAVAEGRTLDRDAATAAIGTAVRSPAQARRL